MWAALQQLLEGRRHADAAEFRGLCRRLGVSDEDADAVFRDLDKDRDGRIGPEDLAAGFADFLDAGEQRQDAASDDNKLKWLFNELQMSEQKHLVPYLENAVEELLNSVNQLEDEKLRLEEVWKREKQEHEKHLRRMEEEMDNQVKETELKMRMKAQEEVEVERKNLQSRMDSELEKLQSHLQLVERVYAWLRSQPGRAGLDEVHAKLDDAARDNRQLRMSLLDTQTSVALMRTELLQLRTLYDERCCELSSERERILEVLQEQDHLSRQLNLMHDANKRLFDSHDVIRNTMESPIKQIPSNLKRCRSGSIVGDYLDIDYSHGVLERFQTDDDENSELSNAKGLSYVDDICAIHRRSDRQEVQNQSDSGVSTAAEEQQSWPRGEEDPGPRRQFQLCEYGKRNEYSVVRKSSSQDSALNIDSMPKRKISDIKKQLGIEDKPTNWNKSLITSPLQCSTPIQRPLPNLHSEFVPVPMPRMSKINAIYESIDDGCSWAEASGPAEHTFKVIFVGDAGVGKSSFALRISKGVFVRTLSSTLGLDFLMRTLSVDGKNVAVQLWDTAGQERFRSITKTYFRKADGVMLLYDCSCEHSFLNVRQWVEDIEESCFYSMMAENPATGRASCSQRIPLMIIANKIDLREVAIKSGRSCISREQGEKLAKDCGTLFMEASAKDGSNILNSLVKLIRSMSTYQDLQMSASTMQLAEAKPKKSSCCGK